MQIKFLEQENESLKNMNSSLNNAMNEERKLFNLSQENFGSKVKLINQKVG